MSPALEIVVQIFGLALALLFMKRAYTANKKAEPFSLKAHLRSSDLSKGFNDLYLAKGLFVGLILIILLVSKLMSCGLVCWS